MKNVWIQHQRRMFICASCLLTLLLVDFIVRRGEPILRDYDVAVYDRVINGFHEAPRPDIVLMGSSRTGYALDPEVFERITGHTAYNVAVSGTKTVEWSALAKRFFDHHKPKLVVLGINASEVRFDYVPEPAAKNLFNFGELLESMQVDGMHMQVIGGYLHRTWAPLWKTFERRYEISLWARENFASLFPKHAQIAREVRERATRPTPPNGYNHPWMHGRQKENLTERLMEDRATVLESLPPTFRPDGPACMRLASLLDWFREQSLNVLVVYIPNSPRTENRWRDIEPVMIARIEEICREKRVRFLPCDQSVIARVDEDYIHEIHVGWPLGRRISERVAFYIQSHALTETPYDLPYTQIASMELDP